MFLEPNIEIIDVIEIIKHKIKTKTPFCLTRYGDGEVGALKRNYSGFTRKFFCDLYNYKLPKGVNQLYKDSKGILLKGIKGSDIIGVVNTKTKLVPKNIYNDLSWRLKVNFLESHGINHSELVMCDSLLFRDKRLGDIHRFKEILNGSSLHIITSNKSKLDIEKSREILEVDVNITNYPQSINLNNREGFIQELGKIKEDVVLFGTGFNKDYGVILKEVHGKIALDFGATLDAWAGIVSRPWFKKNGPQHYLVIK